MVKVAFVTPELQSLVRRTHLAGVAQDLAVSIVRAGADCRVFIPRTVDLDTTQLRNLREVGRVTISQPDGEETFVVRAGRLGDLDVFLFEHPRLFGERHPYGDENGPYQDNWRRYALFSRAVLAATDVIGFPADVYHCMDWSSGLLPLIQKLEYHEAETEHSAKRAGTFFSVHNLAMQGEFEREILGHTGIPHEFFRGLEGVEVNSKVNFMKAGAEFGTVIGTHSPSHAKTIQTPDRGYGLEETFERRKKEVLGIHNGIDYKSWDPRNDPLLPAAFSAEDSSGKARCKADLAQALNLDIDPNSLLCCHVGRWDADSGFDLMAEVLSSILERDVQLVIMGAGGDDILKRLRTIEGTFVGRARVIEGYDPAAAHRLMGGADVLLMPSHYQPTNPLFAVALRYGVVPLIYDHSGLEETLPNALTDEQEGLGIHFDPYTGEGLLAGVLAAQAKFKDTAQWKALVERCMQQDFSWERAAAEYVKAYRRVTRRIRGR